MKYSICMILGNKDEVFLGFTEATTKEEAAEKLGLRVVMIGDKQVFLDPGSAETDAVTPTVHFLIKELMEINSMLQLVQVAAKITMEKLFA